jgi:hypothetical protein
MPLYYVEGIYTNKLGAKKQRKTGAYPPDSIEPFAKTIWANSPEDAIQLATNELYGGEWTKKPKVSQLTEEQRMRSMGAPEFPGLSSPIPKSRKGIKTSKR